MTDKIFQQLVALSGHLSSRRLQIMDAWSKASEEDPDQTTADSLTRAQFNDHMPQVLEALENKLAIPPDGRLDAVAEEKQKLEEMKHGQHRWQQGYRLREVTREWGHLHLFLCQELMVFAASHPNIESETIAEAHYELIRFVNTAINESLSQYVRMEKESAADRARDLERALAELAEVERQRGTLIREAVHDLGGSMQTVTSAASILGFSHLPEERRAVVVETIERGVKTLRVMLGELMSLARLEAGQEKRHVAPFDVAELFKELAGVSQTRAVEKGLVLMAEGPESLVVEGDADKLHRIAQNLLINALKYTATGGVVLSWGREGAEHWWLMVKDTGPGLSDGPGSPMVGELKDATESARESDERTVQAGGRSSHVLPPTSGFAGATVIQQPGEGIGLAIVKRLCDLLNASIELTSSSEEGTTFRVLLPVRYESKSDEPLMKGTRSGSASL